MISVIVPTCNDEARLVACLSALVPAAVEGLVRELIIVDSSSTDATLEIAEDAGARVIPLDGAAAAKLVAGARAARGSWVLALDPQVRLEPGWEVAAASHVSTSREPAGFMLRRSESRWLDVFNPVRATALLVLKADLSEQGVVGQGRLGFFRFGRLRRLKARGWA